MRTLFVLLALIASPAFAIPPITITDAGYFATIVGDDGYPAFVKVEVIDLRTGEVPPTDPPTLEPPPAGVSSDAAEWAAEAGDPSGSQKYALILATTRDGVIDEQVSSSNLFEVLRESADRVVDDRWDGFRRKFGDYLTSQLQAGGLLTRDQIADTLELVRYGVAYSAKDSESISMGESVAVVAAVNEVIEESSE